MSGKPKLDMGIVRIYDDAIVAASFSCGRVMPRFLVIADRRIVLGPVLHAWHGCHCSTMLRYYLVAAEPASWKLCFISDACRWMAEEVTVVGH